MRAKIRDEQATYSKLTQDPLKIAVCTVMKIDMRAALGLHFESVAKYVSGVIMCIVALHSSCTETNLIYWGDEIHN